MLGCRFLRGARLRPKDLSEFSYGYALTESLSQSAPAPLRAAPYFPSLLVERKKGGGYDLKPSFSGALLYVQFKLSDLMQRRNAMESKRGLFKPPFFRMPLRASAKSDQHAMLIELEASGEHVFYATPKFNTAKELDRAYLSHTDGVVRESCFFSPLRIGALPDQKAHHVSFTHNNPVAYFCSNDPRELEAMNGRAFLKHLEGLKPARINHETLRRTAERMQQIVLKELTYGPFRRIYEVKKYREKTYEQLREELSEARVLPRDMSQRQLDAFDEIEDVARNLRRLQERPPPEQVAYLARTFFGCEVIRVEAD